MTPTPLIPLLFLIAITTTIASAHPNQKQPCHTLNITIPPQHLDIPSTPSLKRFYPTNNGTLLLVDYRGPLRTVILSDGYAIDHLSYKLSLPVGEHVISISTHTNDTSILTSSSATFVSHHLPKHTVENITVVHQFEGGVGVAKHSVTAVTNRRRAFSAQGVYVVSGIVGKYDSPLGGGVVVTGVEAPSISFDSPADVVGSTIDGNIEISLAYQPPGPDFARWARSGGDVPVATGEAEETMEPLVGDALFDLLSAATVSVRGSTIASRSPIVNWDPAACRGVTRVKRQTDGRYTFPNDACNVGYDDEMSKLVIRLTPEESGRALVTVTPPAVGGGADDVPEVSIHVVVKPAPRKRPIVLLREGVQMELDYYGTEIFTVEMDHTTMPDQKMNASDYIVDLPGLRYARIRRGLSVLEGDVQKITFESVAVGKEDASVVQRLRRAMYMYMENGEVKSSPEVEMPSPEIMAPMRVEGGIDGGSRRMEMMTVSPESTMEMTATSTPEVRNMWVSNVYVIIPPSTEYERATDVHRHGLQTEFAGKELAEVSSLVTEQSTSYIKVVVELYGYGLRNFSEHKSQQVGRAVAQLTSNETRIMKQAELTRKQERSEPQRVIATYRIAVPANAREVARNLTVREKEVARVVAREAMLSGERVALYDARPVSGSGGPNYSGAGGGASTGLSGTTVGLIVVAVVVLTILVSIPLFAMCFAHLVTRRQQQREAVGIGEEDDVFNTGGGLHDA